MKVEFDGLKIKADESDMLTIYYALAEYRDKLVSEMATCYGGNANYCTEDDMFLGSQIGKISRMMFEIEQAEPMPLATAARKVYEEKKVVKPYPGMNLDGKQLDKDDLYGKQLDET